MELEAQWWTGQLAADIHQALRYKELKLPSYKGQSPQLHLRRYFADLIAIVSNRFRLCPAARHLAVYLLDLFMDRYDISIQQLHVVALSCLLLANHAFLNYAPSLVATACVASSRIILRLSPTWPTRLHHLTAYSWDFLVPCIERLLIAHDNDVKEANKQKGQHAQSAQHTVFQTPAPQQANAQQHIPQYLQAHQSSLQYHHQTSQQQNCQQVLSSNHTASYPLQTCPAALQSSTQARGHVQTGAAMSLAVPLEVKPCVSVSYNRSYQVNGRYSCITPCFER
ncbi:cyclin-J isoform X3 [Colius striatus]|uniref:cyclin-J isoform X3 n=1 Tax=Colius striatus TaxID=57412 RepID=UPI002B1E7C11|nr:cyclin-J isoform X3 [Colius striatus]